MAKRKVDVFDLEDLNDPAVQRVKFEERTKKHTLDSDEEDSADEDKYNVMNEEDIEGEEDGISGMEGDVKITPFNMKEELEEGHFDREGHFQWDKSKEIKDNWLDNIDWVKVKTDKKYIEKTNRGLADSSDSEDEDKQFNPIETYKEIIKMMKPKETINKTLQRLGRNTAKLSSAERWKRKKAGIVCEETEAITKLTALTNDILTKLGNMDVYDETYEQIERKIKKHDSKSSSSAAALDMYADDFDGKEKLKLGAVKSSHEGSKDADEPEETTEKDSEEGSNVVQWEFKWKQDDNEIYGPYPTEQMQKWVEEGYFTSGVFVRKVGEDSRFYTSNRIDFELYL